MKNSGKSASATGYPAVREPDPVPRAAPREIASEALLGDSRSIRIRHGCEVYTLQRTSNGKLILTK